MAYFMRVLVLSLILVSPVSAEWRGTFSATAYLPSCNGTFVTATGKRAIPAHRYVAVDPKVIPLHSTVCIDNLGCYTAEDTGGAIKGNKLDILMANRTAALLWGRRKVQVTVYPYQKGNK